MEFTKALVMLDLRDVIVCTEGIRNTERINFRRTFSSGVVTLDDLPLHVNYPAVGSVDGRYSL
jgi:hypothetical protein